MQLTLFTFGTYGDVRPYVALGGALQNAGYTVQVATAEKYRSIIEQAHLPFQPLSGNPDDLVASFGDMTEGGSPLDNLRQIRALLPHLGNDLLGIAADTDALICNFNMTHIAGTVAEKMKIPLIEVGLMPMLPTRDYANPHIFVTEPHWLPSAFNRATYTPVDLMLWLPFRDVINRWRREIGLQPQGIIGPFALHRRQNTRLQPPSHPKSIRLG